VRVAFPCCPTAVGKLVAGGLMDLESTVMWLFLLVLVMAIMVTYQLYELERVKAQVAALEADLAEARETNAYWYELFTRLGVLPERVEPAPEL